LGFRGLLSARSTGLEAVPVDLGRAGLRGVEGGNPQETGTWTSVQTPVGGSTGVGRGDAVATVANGFSDARTPVAEALAALAQDWRDGLPERDTRRRLLAVLSLLEEVGP
jgi:hypothetical protein